MGQRSAASIARRLQDPLAELVKIDPKSIGVGQYQHDMNQKKLGEYIVRSCGRLRQQGRRRPEYGFRAHCFRIFQVSAKAIAKNIVAYREENGRFARQKAASESCKAWTEGI